MFAIGNKRTFTFRDELCETEVEDLCVPIAIEHEVLGFQIAMNNPEFVCAIETGANLNCDVEDLAQLQAVILDLLAQRFAFDVLHRDVRSALILTDFVNGEDVWMAQRRSGARFLKEATAAILLRNVLRREQLQRHHALELIVVGFVNGAHTTGANGFHDSVMRDRFYGEGFHGGVGRLDYTRKNQGRRIVVSFESPNEELAMICPRCASNQVDDIKFCTACGANLEAVREALARRESGKAFDWGDTWVAEMFMSHKAQEARKRELERQMGITPEIKRYQEIKAGVIVSSIGIGLSIFLYWFMQGVVGHVGPEEREIIRRIWIAGIIPFMVGLALIINGVVVSKKMVEIQQRDEERHKDLGEGAPTPRGLRAADTSEFIPTGVSVTEGTTRHLSNTGQKVDR